MAVVIRKGLQEELNKKTRMLFMIPQDTNAYRDNVWNFD
jgi:hypothetical protein